MDNLSGSLGKRAKGLMGGRRRGAVIEAWVDAWEGGRCGECVSESIVSLSFLIPASSKHLPRSGVAAYLVGRRPRLQLSVAQRDAAPPQLSPGGGVAGRERQ